jgi:transcriptional regulator with XRE-family HTH domain
MTSRVRSTKEAQARLSQQLRAEGKTWREVADIFRLEFKLNARVAFRLAHGWSQTEAAKRWSDRWPSDPKTFKSISYWEQWPNKTGYTPSLDVLSRLADLYECSVSDLLVDIADFRDRDSMHRARLDLQRLPGALRPTEADDDLFRFIQQLSDSDPTELAKLANVWALQVDTSHNRRSLLLKLSFALTLAASTNPEHDKETSESPSTTTTSTQNLDGIWRSEYTYYSSGRQQHFTGVHYVIVRQTGQQLSIESLPHTTGSELSLSLSVDGLFATGSWQERTSPTGYYQGAIYRGAIQLLITPSLTQMTGKWLGFGKDFTIDNGDWSLKLETRSTSAKAVREYSKKA